VVVEVVLLAAFLALVEVAAAAVGLGHPSTVVLAAAAAA
jgi:hypothetical protein